MDDLNETIEDETQWCSQVNHEKWNQLYHWTSNHANWRLSELSKLIIEMRRLPVFLKFYPYTSHFTFGLSSRPFAMGHGPRAEALGNGRFKVYSSHYKLVEKQTGQEHDYEVLGEADVKGAVDLMRNALNPDSGLVSGDV